MKAKTVEKFKAWLTAHGAEVLIPTNEWEVLRFRANGKVSIVYRNKRGDQTFTEEAEAAFAAYNSNKPWSAGVRKTSRIQARSVAVRSIIARDGEGCFYCGGLTEPGDETIEHLLARAHGGSNHLSNLVIAHNACNADAGHLSVMEKILRRQRMHVPISTAT